MLGLQIMAPILKIIINSITAYIFYSWNSQPLLCLRSPAMCRFRKNKTKHKKHKNEQKDPLHGSKQ